MHSDHLQGILFDRPGTLDLTQRRRRLSLRRKIRVSHYIHVRRLEANQLVTSRKRKKQHEALVSDLQQRLKVRDY